MQIKMGFSTPEAFVTFLFYSEQCEVSLNHSSLTILSDLSYLFIYSNQDNHVVRFTGVENLIYSNIYLDMSFVYSWVFNF